MLHIRQEPSTKTVNPGTPQLDFVEDILYMTKEARSLLNQNGNITEPDSIKTKLFSANVKQTII